MPRGLLPNGAVRQVEPPWAGKMPILAPLFDALVPMLCQQMAFAAPHGRSAGADTGGGDLL